MDAKVLKVKLSLIGTAPYEVLTVDPCSSANTLDGSTPGAKLIYSDLPSDMPGAGAHRCVSVQRFGACANFHDRDDRPKYLPAGLTHFVLKYVPAGLTQFVLYNFCKKFLP